MICAIAYKILNIMIKSETVVKDMVQEQCTDKSDTVDCGTDKVYGVIRGLVGNK